MCNGDDEDMLCHCSPDIAHVTAWCVQMCSGGCDAMELEHGQWKSGGSHVDEQESSARKFKLRTLTSTRGSGVHQPLTLSVGQFSHVTTQDLSLAPATCVHKQQSAVATKFTRKMRGWHFNANLVLLPESHGHFHWRQ